MSPNRNGSVGENPVDLIAGMNSSAASWTEEAIVSPPAEILIGSGSGDNL
jgi:hypothetical protein